MKKFINKILLVFAIISLLVPSTYVMAEPEENGTNPPSSTETTQPGGENQNGESGEDAATPAPSPTPETPKVEAKLDSLSITGYTLKETFSKDKTDYTLTVKSDVEKITIEASAGEGITVTGSGEQELKEGLNTFTITALAGEEHTTYTIKVTRSTSDLSLKILSITGHPLNETFDPTVTDYTADVTYDTQSVIVKAGANNKDATPQISGNSNLKVGKNTVKIIVKNSSGESQEYRIIVNRLAEEEQEEITDDDSTSLTSSETVTSSVTTAPTPNEDNNDKNNDDSLNYILVVLFCVLLLIIAGLGIYFYIRTGNVEKRRQKKIEKLKKKQAKIDQELTALLPVITEEMIEEHERNAQEDETEEFSDKDFEDTIELDKIVEEPIESPMPRKRTQKNVLEDFDDLFLDD